MVKIFGGVAEWFKAPFSKNGVPHFIQGPIAQRLERGTHNPLVPGSNPGRPTVKSRSTTEWIGASLEAR
jgi:hypothetical protein